MDSTHSLIFNYIFDIDIMINELQHNIGKYKKKDVTRNK